MTKRYKNPPLIEAICEFQFDSDIPWDLTLIGLIYDKLKEDFPKKLQLQLNLAIAASTEASQQTGNIPMLPLIRFLDKDEKRLVQIGQNLLTINHLKPYNSWKEFLPIIANVFKIYLETVKPKGLQYIAIRYINRIEIPRANANLENLFHFRPLIPQNLPQKIETFLIGASLLCEDANDTLRIQLGTANPEAPDMIVLILEIVYMFAKANEIALESALQKIDMAHKQVEDAFEFCLTDELKQTFDEVKE